ncbi:MAG TPA: NADP-dependent malic enzyme [Candidatus Saccharimonadales bacterium]|nr:NADP-dependent malic enzyme [Candidatus Saccharimonadales bacterium]
MVDKNKALEEHKRKHGKLEMMPKVPMRDSADLSIYYTPGVAYPCLEIKNQKELVFEYTNKSNMIAIVSDGTRILGLGKIGPEAGLPVMEGKAVLFKRFGGVDAVPLCIDTTDEEEILGFIKNIAPTFGAINIEDIESPKSFRILNRAQAMVDIPIFQDDQQGTAVVAIAGLINALKLAGKGKDARIVINGAGTAGIGVARLAIYAGYKNIVVLDSKGAIYEGRQDEMNDFKKEIARETNREKRAGSLAEMAKGADVLIGLSKKGLFTKEIVQSMNDNRIVFSLANPEPEIEYEDAKAAGAFIAATGRSDKPNQVNNVGAFPGIMRGLLDVRAKGVNDEMLYRAAVAAAKGVGRKLSTEYILQGVFDKGYAKTAANIAAAVAEAAVKTGMARITRTPQEIKQGMKERMKRYTSIEKKIMK